MTQLWSPVGRPSWAHPRGQRRAAAEAPDPGSQESGPELTVHCLLLEEGRHGERPRRGGPARSGSVRPGSGEGTAGRTEPGGGGGWQG